MIAAIVAVDEDWGIGFNNSLLERIPNDLKRFKELTENKIVVMGRKTQESLPNKQLPNRMNIVITNRDIPDEDDVMYTNMTDFSWLLDFWQNYSMGIMTTGKGPLLKDMFVIGGGSIYYQLLPHCNRIYLTKIYKHHDDIDTYFPNIDQMTDEWELTETSELFEYNDFQYQYLVYDRKNY